MKAAKLTEHPSFRLMRQTDIQNVWHMQMPRWLFSDPRYADMSLDAKVAYTFLLNRFQLSRRNGWVNDATYPILYGDITKHPEYKPYMRIQVEERYALNSQGKSVPIQEVGWAAEGELPTHIVLQFTSSHGGAYIGSPGNTMWIDNVELIY